MGHNYQGWQLQPGVSTIQGMLEEKLQILCKAPIRIHGAGRTDAGVHAWGQVAHFHADTPLTVDRLRIALNGMLPMDISVREVEEVPLQFHSRFDAIGKTYRYEILTRRSRSALLGRRSWHVWAPLDEERMAAALPPLLGTHNFVAFQGANSSVTNTIRTLTRVELTKEPWDLLVFTVEGTGFLKHMVRSIVGTLVDIGLGRCPPTHMQYLVESGDRSAVGHTAPPQGLVLVKVHYADAENGRESALDED